MSDTETENLQTARDKSATSYMESLADAIYTMVIRTIEIYASSVPDRVVLLAKPFKIVNSRKKFLANWLIEKLSIWRDSLDD